MFVSGLILRGMNTDVRMASNPIAGPFNKITGFSQRINAIEKKKRNKAPD